MTLTLTLFALLKATTLLWQKTVILPPRTLELLVAEIHIQHLYSSSAYIFLEYHNVFIIFLKPSHNNSKTWSCCPMAQLLYYRILVTTFPWSFEYLADWNLLSDRPPCLSLLSSIVAHTFPPSLFHLFSVSHKELVSTVAKFWFITVEGVISGSLESLGLITEPSEL